MYELSVAFKYLIPRKRQLSVSIISLISTLVIGLVVWLIVVFFSVKNGIENSWIEKIIALTAPVRLTPTENYYHSRYYLLDTLSSASNYTNKTIHEKLSSANASDYNEALDEEIPSEWPKADNDPLGKPKDLVKLAYLAANNIKGVKGIKVSDYETTFSILRLRLLRHAKQGLSQQFLENESLLGTFDLDTPEITNALIIATNEDFDNLLQMQGVSSENVLEDSPSAIYSINSNSLHKRLENYFKFIKISSLKTPESLWKTPLTLFPKKGSFTVLSTFKNGQLIKITLPAVSSNLQDFIKRDSQEGYINSIAQLDVDDGLLKLILNEKKETVSFSVPIVLQANLYLNADLVEASVADAKTVKDIKFEVNFTLQQQNFKGVIRLGNLEVGNAFLKEPLQNPLIAFPSEDKRKIVMPTESNQNDFILLPKTFKEKGVSIGDSGYVSYYSPTPSSIQELRSLVYVAGFYDPGIIPMGGKFILGSRRLVSSIRAATPSNDASLSNGINIRFDNLKDVDLVKSSLQKQLDDLGIAPYWKISTYQDYEFTKDIIQQLQSEKNLFSLISLVIIIVACSNIISMLIILVNDKKVEIGILRSMGASSKSIALIFGLCGMVMGTIGSFIGILLAILTLFYINELVQCIGRLQGFDLFNPIFYGHTLPSSLSMEALLYVMVATAFISLLAGIVPALKASLIRPAEILRAE